MADSPTDPDELAALIAFCRASPVRLSEQLRVQKVLVLLASRGIAVTDPEAAAWLAPVLCVSAEEQAEFHLRFAPVSYTHLRAHET